MSGLIVWKKQEMDRLRKDMDRLIERLCDDFCIPSFPRITRELPSFDLLETEENLVLSAEIPGIDPENLEVTVTDDKVTVQADQRQESVRGGRDHESRESRYGFFSRTFQLPCKVLVDDVKGSYKQGRLTVVMPKSKAESRRGIQIKVT